MEMEHLKIEYLPVKALKPYERNARKHRDFDVDKIVESIRVFGFDDPIGIWSDQNIIVEGHGRLLAAKKLGMQTVPCIRLDHLTDEQRRAYALAHNKTAENSEWDLDILPEELDSIIDIDMTQFGFDLVDNAEVVEDDYEPVVPEDPKAKIGQLYQLGRHRLMCGDSTVEADVIRLCNGWSMDMVLTDPPYNVNLGNCGSKDEARKRHMRLDGLVIQNDNMDSAQFQEFLVKAFSNIRAALRKGGVFHVWHAESESVNFRTALKKCGLPVRQMLIWVKSSPAFGRQDFQRQYEGVLTGEAFDLEEDDSGSGYDTALYGWKDGSAHSWYKDRKQRDVLFFDKPKASKEHPTMKPVLLFDYEMRCNTKPGDMVLDLFGGSGTTMIAAEQNGRTAFVMEYDPRFVDVIIDRWEKFTGGKAVLLND